MHSRTRGTCGTGLLRPVLAVSMATLIAYGGAQTALAAPAPSSDTASPTSGASWLPSTPANWPLVVDYSRTAPSEITRGVDQYAETYDTVAGRRHIQVLTADLADPNVRTGVVEAGDSIIDPADETTSSMAHRTGAVAGVNGGYFDINATGQPLGGVVSDGTILKSPVPGFAAQLGVKPDGTMVMGAEDFSGTVTDGTASHALSSVNTTNDSGAGKITEITPYLGAVTGLTSATFVLGHTSSAANGAFTVDSVQTGATSVARLATGQIGLLAAGAGGQWLAGSVHVGDTVQLASQLSPDNDLTQLISGVTMLVKDGQVYNDPTGTPPSGVNPETAIGISKDGKHVIAVAIDGRGTEDTAVGVSPAEAAGYLVAHGAYTAELFDGGGSTTEVARLPGQTRASVVNTPSDLPGNTERPVADGLFFYSTAGQAGAAVRAVVDGGRPLYTVAGGSIPVPAYATDALGNPAAGEVHVQVEPPSLASWSDGVLTPHRAGVGTIIVSDGHAYSTEKLTVEASLASLSVSPNTPDVAGGATQQLTLSGTDRAGNTVQVPAEAATWKVDPPALGSVDAHGLFTAASSGGGMATVSATSGGATATASVAVGSVSQILDSMTSTAEWSLSNNTTDRSATLAAEAGDVPPGSTETGSLQLSYTMPAGSGVKQLVLSPKTALETTAVGGHNPNAIAMWVKGNDTGIELAESYIGVDGVRTTLYPTTVTWNGWQLVAAQLPAGLHFPLSISFVDFLAISPTTTTTSTLNVSDLQSLYSPRPVAAQTYQAIPGNPAWLSYQENPTSAEFAKQGPDQGSMLLLAGDADLTATAPTSPAATVMQAIAADLPALGAAEPDAAQFLGDMSGDGTSADLQYAKSAMDALCVSDHDLVGSAEISKGTYPETGNYAQILGDTHYAYTEGAADVIVTDSAHGGILASDPYQSPAVSAASRYPSQYQWLVRQLSGVTSATKDVVVATQLPAYDPTSAGKNQFTDAWEAQMYVRLLQKFQQSHPGVHVVMVAGDATGFSEQILDPQGERVSARNGGIPQFTFADLGTASAAEANQGGFAQYGLLRIGARGDIQFAVQPVLTAITVTAPASVAAGTSAAPSATGTEAGGGTMPIADPASHVWRSSDPRIASVDAVTGKLTAHRPGNVTVSVTSGGITATAVVAVTAAVAATGAAG